MKVRHALTYVVARPRDRVVAVATDPHLVPEYDDRIAAVETNGLPPGSTGFAAVLHTKDPALGPVRGTVLHGALPDEVVSRTEFPSFTSRTRTTFVALAPDVTQVREEQEIDLLWWQPLHVLVARATLARTSDDAARKAQAFLESRA